MKDHAHNGTITVNQLLFPMTLIAASFCLLMSFQMSQILRDRDALISTKVQQEKGIEDTQKIQAQLVALIVGTQKLATDGNQNAAKIVERLKGLGVIPQQQQPATVQPQGQQAAPRGVAGEPVTPAPMPIQSPEIRPVKP